MKNRIISLLVVALCSTTLFSQNSNLIKLRSGDLSLQEIPDNEKIESVVDQTPSNGDYYFMQFDRIPDENQKSYLEAQGIELLEYIPEYAFITDLSNLGSNADLGAIKVRAIAAYSSTHKFPNYFDLASAPDYVLASNDQYRLVVDPHLNIDAASFANLLEGNGIQVEKANWNAQSFNVIISSQQLDWLASNEFVKFVDYAPAPPEAEDTRARSLHRNNLLDADDPMGRNLNGDSVSIAIADNGLGPHIDRKGRVTMHTSVNNGTHGDMTTGIAVGAGNLDPTIRGMATHSYLHYYNISGYPHINQAINNLNIRGVVITSTSFSQGCNAGYTSDTRGVDQQVRFNPELLHVFSAGNSAGSSCGGNNYGAGTPWGTITGGIKQAKSTIATGNLDYRGVLTASSSRGPAADGRIKPDICANGTNQLSTDPNNGYSPGGGTSAAAPSIAGISAQLYQGYRNLNNQTNPPSSLIKATLLNTARDIGNPGPDFFFGWGRVNADRAMKLLEDQRYIDASISQNGNNSHSINIPAGLKELKVMVYWQDFEGSTVASKALVNDLDIQLVTPNNDTLLPWVLDPTPNSVNLSRNAVRGVDDLNNMEQVSIDTVAAGTYTVLVNGKAIPNGPQAYHLLWETISDTIKVTYPAGGEAFNPGESQTIRWDASGNSGTFNVEYSLNNGNTWNSIGSVAGSFRYTNWTVPFSTSGDALVRVSRSGSVTGVSNNNFSLMAVPSGLSTNFTCPDSVEIGWNSVPGATDYTIYMLGATHMDSIGSTNNTDYRIYNLNLADENWYAIKATGVGINSRRTVARLMNTTVTNCPIPYDMAITAINSPNSDYIPSCAFNKLPVRVTINNNGDSILRNVPIKLRAGATVFYDTIPGPLNPGSFQFFTFKDSIPLNTPGFLNISAIAEFQGDGNELNDSVGTNIEVIPGTTFNVPYSNDFENFGLCATTNNCGGTSCNLNGGWINIRNSADDFDMRVNQGTTPSSGTGPTLDANPGTTTGKYIYSEASNNCYGQVSEVLTPCFDLSGTISPEFSFKYHLLGTSLGVIRLDIFSNGNWTTNIITPLFGNQGNVWLTENVDLSQYAGQKVTLRFRIQTGSSWSSDIAIDDVSLIDQSTSLSENQQKDYRLYPNPSNGFFNLQLNEGNIGGLRIFDLQGRTVYSTELNNPFAEIDLNGLDKGVYLLEFKDGEVREKIIIQ